MTEVGPGLPPVRVTGVGPGLPPAREVEVRRTSVPAVVITLLAAAIVFGGIAFAIGAAVVTVSQTEQGLCGTTVVPCTSLSVERVADLSDIAFPAGSTVLDASLTAHTAASGGPADGSSGATAVPGSDDSLSALRAEVLLPAGATSPLAMSANPPTTESCPTPASTDLSAVTCYASSNPTDGTSIQTAEGTRADGRVVVVIDAVVRPAVKDK